jgi:hypothetical protein
MDYALEEEDCRALQTLQRINNCRLIVEAESVTSLELSHSLEMGIEGLPLYGAPSTIPPHAVRNLTLRV